MILAGSWLVLMVVAPTLISVLATTTYPAPSRFEFIAATRVVQTQVEKDYMKALDKYYYDHAEFAPKGSEADFLATSLAKNDAVEKAMMPLYNKFRSQLAKQDEMVANFQFVSLAIMMQRTLNDASGASAARYSHFIDQVIDFRQVWTKHFTTRFLAGKPLRSGRLSSLPKVRISGRTGVGRGRSGRTVADRAVRPDGHRARRSLRGPAQVPGRLALTLR